MSTVQQPMRPHDAARATVRAVPTRMCRVVDQLLPGDRPTCILYTRWPGLLLRLLCPLPSSYLGVRHVRSRACDDELNFSGRNYKLFYFLGKK